MESKSKNRGRVLNKVLFYHRFLCKSFVLEVVRIRKPELGRNKVSCIDSLNNRSVRLNDEIKLQQSNYSGTSRVTSSTAFLACFGRDFENRDGQGFCPETDEPTV